MVIEIVAIVDSEYEYTSPRFLHSHPKSRSPFPAAEYFPISSSVISKNSDKQRGPTLLDSPKIGSTSIQYTLSYIGMYRRALTRNPVVSRITAQRTVSTFVPRIITAVARNPVQPTVQQQGFSQRGVRYSSGMSALNEAQNPQVGEGLEGGKGGSAAVIDGNAIAK